MWWCVVYRRKKGVCVYVYVRAAVGRRLMYGRFIKKNWGLTLRQGRSGKGAFGAFRRCWTDFREKLFLWGRVTMGRWAARCRQVVPGGAVSWLGGAAARKPKRIREELGGPHFKTRRLCKRRPSRLLVASVTKSGIGWHHSSSRRSYANSRDDLACKYKCSKDVQDVSVILSQHPTPQDMSSSLQLQIRLALQYLLVRSYSRPFC